jgi:hypothetical protein
MYRTSQINRSEIYLNVLPLFTSGRARLIDNPRLISQFANLERRTFPTGRDRIDHDRSGHDDLCNAAAGAMDLASRTSAKPLPIHPHPDLSKSGNAYNAPNTNGVPSRYLAKHNEPWRPYVGGSVLPRITGKYWEPIGQ